MSQTNLTASNDVTTIMMSSNSEEESGGEDVMQILQSIIASVGIVANLTVVIVFSNHKKLRRKIPNRFIVNQVSAVNFTFFSSWHRTKRRYSMLLKWNYSLLYLFSRTFYFLFHMINHNEQIILSSYLLIKQVHISCWGKQLQWLRIIVYKIK